VSDGLKTTLELLTKTRNEAATRALIPSLDSRRWPIQSGALRALLDRHSPAAHREILKRLHTVDGRWRGIIEQRPGRMLDALREAIVGHDAQLYENACQAILWQREYSLIGVLVPALEDPNNPNAERAAQTVLELAELLYDELAAPRDYGNRRDPQVMRRNVIGSLEPSVRRYSQHQRREVLDAFLILSHRENSTLKQILMEPHHGTYLPLIDALAENQHGGVSRLILSYLDDPRPPLAVLNVLARRSDRRFLEHLLDKVGDESSAVAKQNLKRIDAFPWLDLEGTALDRLDDLGQQHAMKLLVWSGVNRTHVFQVIEHLLVKGKPLGRGAATMALAEFRGPEADMLALAALGDYDPEVQAQAARQLRSRGVPGALQHLIDLLDSPHAVVRQAARENLGEFMFPRFMAAYDTLDERARHSTGLLVRKVDLETAPLLLKELHSPVRTRRLRAIDVAGTIGIVPEVESAIIELLDDEDYVIRIEAATALAQSVTPKSRRALEAALQDTSNLVQDAAERSLQRFSEPIDFGNAASYEEHAHD
jgi:HEAT repeat protein